MSNRSGKWRSCWPFPWASPWERSSPRPSPNAGEGPGRPGEEGRAREGGSGGGDRGQDVLQYQGVRGIGPACDTPIPTEDQIRRARLASGERPQVAGVQDSSTRRIP